MQLETPAGWGQSQTQAAVERRRGGRLNWLWHLLLLPLAIFFVLPTLWMISSSLKASTEVFSTTSLWLPSDPQWSNYTRAFTVLPLGRFIWNTVAITGLAVLGTVVSSCLVAYSFARLRWPGRNIWFALLLTTLMLPDIITLVPRFILFRNLGWIDTWLPLIVPYWTAASALYVFLLRQFFRNIPNELTEAALIDGAGQLRILFQIILPLAGPAVATVAVFALIERYNDFLNPLIFLGSMERWPLSVGLRAYNEAYVGNWELVFAASTVMLLPMLLLFLLAQRFFVQGIALTGLGGR
jgi:ABC-type glycerol-3-phosphate transport system permease component